MKTWRGKEIKKNHYVLTIFSCIFFAGIGSVVPFYSVHMRSLGLSTVKDAVFVHTASALACCILPIIVLSIAQRKFILSIFISRKVKHNPLVGKRSLSKWCLCGCLIASAAFHASLLTVPREVWIPRQPLMDFDCGASFVEVAALRVEKCFNWDTCRDVSFSWPKGTRFRVSHCRQRCPSDLHINTSLSTLLHPLHVCFRKLSPDGPSKTGKNSKHLCRVHDSQMPKAPMLEFEAELGEWRFSEFRNVSVTEFLILDPRTPEYFVDVCAFTPANTLWLHDEAYDAISCRPNPPDPSCSLQCLLTVIPGKHEHKLDYSRVEACYEVMGNHDQTFWLYLGFRAIVDAVTCSAICLLDYHLLDGGSTNYGQRFVWPALVMSITSPAVGLLIDYCGEWVQTKPNFSPAFLITSGLMLIACAISVLIPLPEKSTGRYFLSVSMTEQKIMFWWTWTEAIYVESAAVFMGCFWGFSQVFSPWLYQQELGFKHWMLGAMDSLCFGCSLPLLLLSTQLLRNVGDAHIVSTSFAFHGLRLLGLSFLNADGAKWWWPLPFEAMRAVSLPIGWIGFCKRSSRALTDDSKDLLVTLHCLLNILHFGIGRLLGVSTGGYLSEIYGFAFALRVLGGLAMAWAVLSLLLHHLYFRPRHRNKVSVSQRQEIERVLSVGSSLDLRMTQWSVLNGGSNLLSAASAEPEDIDDLDDQQQSNSERRSLSNRRIK